MKLTKEHYEAAMQIWEEFNLNVNRNGPFYVMHLKEKIAELSKPAPKKYRCINNSWPFEMCRIGNLALGYTFDYALFPNHFEPVPEEKPYTMAEAAKELEFCLTSEASRKWDLSKLLERMKKAAQ